MSTYIKELKFNPGETITQYLRRAKEFKLEIEEQDYNTILDFLNELLDLTGKFKMESLRDFKRIKHDDLFLDPDRNKKLLQKYSSKFLDNLDYKLSDDTINNMRDEHLINIIRDLLKKINYRLKRRKLDSGYHYNIRSE